MNLYLFKLGAIGITYFMLFNIVSIAVSYILLRFVYNDHDIDRSVIDDVFFFSIFSAFVGARLSYVIFNYDIYKGNILSIISINHYNLYLFGGIIGVLLTLIYYSKKYKINYDKLLSVLSIPFYFSISIGIWSLYFDAFIKTNIDKSIVYLLLSITFILGILLESITKKIKSKYISILNLSIVLFLYYLIKFLLM